MRHRKWTLERCQEKAEQFDTLQDWRRHHSLSYKAAVRRGWLDKCVRHMVPLRRSPTPTEKRALEILAQAGGGRIDLHDVARILELRVSTVRKIMRC